MHQETTSLPLQLSSLHLNGTTAALESVVLPQVTLSQDLRGSSVDVFAVRSGLRSGYLTSAFGYLQKYSGMMLSVSAWVVFLAGLAHLIIAALHNHEGELGLGINATLAGAKYCLASFALAGVGVSLWLYGARRLSPG